ncbi:hypothetical protein PC121_g9235 [Phytophthora cactorum]|nr:hypothetical protein PC120_g7169 [Phytophthora cactorum]KAG3071413.1 hypothetical protein PC121_g9235 [Phytophthora cactorum]KAG4057689.1 hypothetical protein PC123_g7319 [Phytophthora cactorum]
MIDLQDIGESRWVTYDEEHSGILKVNAPAGYYDHHCLQPNRYRIQNITSRAKLRRDEVFARHAKDPHMRTANLKEFKVGLHKYNATRCGTKSKTTKIRFH